jgi:hypothetical protein
VGAANSKNDRTCLVGGGRTWRPGRVRERWRAGPVAGGVWVCRGGGLVEGPGILICRRVSNPRGDAVHCVGGRSAGASSEVVSRGGTFAPTGRRHVAPGGGGAAVRRVTRGRDLRFAGEPRRGGGGFRRWRV